MLVFVTAAVAGNRHDVFNAHPGSKERNSQEEADNEHGNHHENPGQRLELTVTERLERASANHTDEDPHKNGVPVTRDGMVQETGN